MSCYKGNSTGWPPLGRGLADGQDEFLVEPGLQRAVGGLVIAYGVHQAHQAAGHADLVIVPLHAMALLGRAEGIVPTNDGLVWVAGVGDHGH